MPPIEVHGADDDLPRALIEHPRATFEDLGAHHH